MTKSNRGRNSQINDRCGQFSNLSEILSVSTLSISLETFDQSLMSYADDKVKQRLFQQSRGRNYKTNDPIWPFFELVRIDGYDNHFPIVSLWSLVVAIANNVFIGFS